MKISARIFHLFWLIVSISLSVLVIGCIDEDTEPEVIVPKDMNLDRLELGQTYRYILFTGRGYRDGRSEDYEYTGDTLEVRVIGIEDGNFVLAEKITDKSRMKMEKVDYYWQPVDSVFVSQWHVRNDSLLVHQESNNEYFFSHLFSRRGISLKKFDQREVQITGWVTSQPYEESDLELFVKSFDLLGQNYKNLNVFINNRPMSYDAQGATYVYSREQGIVRTVKYSWWTASGYGWDKL